ncbi:hypothetical protein FB451DRAFT_1172491 [Mycena latifolia]|nr:hypothetical protein FB451DRAFT_1172491 [Mycena latifolia]
MPAKHCQKEKQEGADEAIGAGGEGRWRPVAVSGSGRMETAGSEAVEARSPELRRGAAGRTGGAMHDCAPGLPLSPGRTHGAADTGQRPVGGSKHGEKDARPQYAPAKTPSRSRVPVAAPRPSLHRTQIYMSARATPTRKKGARKGAPDSEIPLGLHTAPHRNLEALSSVVRDRACGDRVRHVARQAAACARGRRHGRNRHGDGDDLVVLGLICVWVSAIELVRIVCVRVIGLNSGEKEGTGTTDGD